MFIGIYFEIFGKTSFPLALKSMEISKELSGTKCVPNSRSLSELTHHTTNSYTTLT